MPRALLGAVGGADQRLVDEVRRLRRRVGELEQETARLRAERDVLSAAILERHEPVGELTVPADLAELEELPAPALR
jgi:hypothetical protein